MSHFRSPFMRRFKQKIGKKEEENPRKIVPFYKPGKVVSCISKRNLLILSVLTIKVKLLHELFRFSNCPKKSFFPSIFSKKNDESLQ